MSFSLSNGAVANTAETTTPKTNCMQLSCVLGRRPNPRAKPTRKAQAGMRSHNHSAERLSPVRSPRMLVNKQEIRVIFLMARGLYNHVNLQQ